MGDSIRVLEGLARRADQIADHVDPGDGSASTGDSSRGHPLTALYEGDQRIENLHIREDHCGPRGGDRRSKAYPHSTHPGLSLSKNGVRGDHAHASSKRTSGPSASEAQVARKKSSTKSG